MKAIITCAGFATRLWPLTKDTPKPLLMIKGKPIVEHLVDKLMEIPDVDGIYVVTNGKFFDSFDAWTKTLKLSMPLKIINDGTQNNEDRLGQIGDVEFVLKQENIDDDVIVAAGDNLFNFSLMDCYKVYQDSRTVVNPLYDIGSVEEARQLGTVVLGENNQFAEFCEKSENPKSTLASLGIYVFPREKVSRVSQYLGTGNSSDKMGYFLTWLMEHDTITGHVYDQKWFDIGWIESLEMARKEFKS